MILQLFARVALLHPIVQDTINKNTRYDHIAPVCFASGLIAYPSILSSIVMLEAIIVYKKRRTLLSLPNGNLKKISNIVFGFILLCSCILPLLTSFKLQKVLIASFFALKFQRHGKHLGCFVLMEYIFICLLICKSIDIGIIMVALYIAHTIHDISQNKFNITNNYIKLKFAISCLMHLCLAMFYFPYHIMQMNAFCLLLIVYKEGLVRYFGHQDPVRSMNCLRQDLDLERAMNQDIRKSLMQNYKDILDTINARIDSVAANNRETIRRLLVSVLSRNDITSAVIENLDADYLDVYREIWPVLNQYTTNYLIFYCDFINLGRDEHSGQLSQLDEVKNRIIAMINSSTCGDVETFKDMLGNALDLLSSIQIQDGIHYKAWQKIQTILQANQSSCKDWLEANTQSSGDNILLKQLIQFYAEFIASRHTLSINFDFDFDFDFDASVLGDNQRKFLRKKEILCLDKESFIRFNEKLSSDIQEEIFDIDRMCDWFNDLYPDEIPPKLYDQWNAISLLI